MFVLYTRFPNAAGSKYNVTKTQKYIKTYSMDMKEIFKGEMDKSHKETQMVEEVNKSSQNLKVKYLEIQIRITKASFTN